MSKRAFLRQYRASIDAVIRAGCGRDFKINDEERWDWVMNDESLYNLAIRNGVNVYA